MKALHSLFLGLLLAGCAAAQAATEIETAIAAYYKGDAATALNLLQPLAENGDAEAQHALGMVLEFGLQQPGPAAVWYGKAAVRGSAAAQNNLGALYYDGHGVVQSYADAMRWYRATAELN
jgi:TPR repeat protein